ncbi:hypothetical protein NC652_007475 [Populus alba x Populus x berolinensis]|nr:hypothetical protein NC652_007475 [Populus alba x Populus x berolinensis]
MGMAWTREMLGVSLVFRSKHDVWAIGDRRKRALSLDTRLEPTSSKQVQVRAWCLSLGASHVPSV